MGRPGTLSRRSTSTRWQASWPAATKLSPTAVLTSCQTELLLLLIVLTALAIFTLLFPFFLIPFVITSLVFSCHPRYFENFRQTACTALTFLSNCHCSSVTACLKSANSSVLRS